MAIVSKGESHLPGSQQIVRVVLFKGRSLLVLAHGFGVINAAFSKLAALVVGKGNGLAFLVRHLVEELLRRCGIALLKTFLGLGNPRIG